MLSACSNDNAEDTSKLQEKGEDSAVSANAKESEQEKSIVEQLKASKLIDSRQAMKEQQSGMLVADIEIDREQTESLETTILDETAVEKLTDELKRLTKETKEPTTMYKGLIYLLGSPNYKEAIEAAEAFEPEFEEPYLPEPGKTEEEIANEPESGKAIILLDASSSMLLPVDNQIKMDVAKEAVLRFGETIGQDSDISLVVYGHKGSESAADKKLSCTGIEELYPMGAYDEAAFEKSLATFDSKGYTPLAGAIEKAMEMSKNFTENVTVYIVSDGVETCDGDPVQVATDFVKEYETRTVNIIGFNVDQDAEAQLKQVSDAGNGEYFAANNADELKTTIEKQWLPSDIDLAWAFLKAPDGWETLAEYERFDEKLNPIKIMIENEKNRYRQALQIMQDEQLVDNDVLQGLQNVINEQDQLITNLMNDFRSEKIEEIKELATAISDKVSSWTEEMKRLKDAE
ncbi:vWA domain-containing protein [Oceanobacillus chungangensis]|uniref:VWFA domain-containing protein n=1 Tax=Oceanobacillus chungangensis TaxID=1229152 RepID=A0A3D8PPW2_9BACI|nr:VWA domain-containing protein [Oceanobacillus chungangensis]RDW18004.1 hypothetical protein CWR45_11795 [Oceanobacillus chungangensis]